MSIRTPKYRLHKGSGQALVQINGRRIYLGVYGSDRSKEKYRRIIATWLTAKPGVSQTDEAIRAELSVSELILQYWNFAKTYYVKNGRPTGELDAIRAALRSLKQLHGQTNACHFGPRDLKAVRQAMIDRENCRNYINANVGRIKRMFRWAVSEDLVPIAVYQSIQTVAGLRAGCAIVRDTEPVSAVDVSHIEAVLPYVTAQVAAMIRLQLLTGARPGEIRSMRPCDVTAGKDGEWIFRPHSHKTEHKNRERRIHLGPKARQILRPWLNRDLVAFCFSPAEAIRRYRSVEKNANCDTQLLLQPNHADGRNSKRHFAASYSRWSYGTAIRRACRKAGIPAWAPNQLRHTRATMIREQYGIEAAQTVLGHIKADVTQVYAERDFELAKRVMRECG